jgi:cysteine desulfurase/selenocysteine lyase
MANPTLTNVSNLRADFPILDIKVGGCGLVYLDNAATSQKPRNVIEGQTRFWEFQNANVHRGVHFLSQLATKRYEEARYAVQRLVNAESAHEIIFTKGCTEAINLVATCLSSASGSNSTVGSSSPVISKGDVLLVSQMEHHSNIVPWQLAAQRTGAIVKSIQVTDRGEIDLEAYERLLRSHPVKVVAIVHISNTLGTINPINEMVRSAHAVGAFVMVDGAQAGPHTRIDVQALDADFYSLSCHKIYAPTGVGALYGKRSLLESLPAYQGGGDMIHTVDIENGTSYAPLPAKYEAGTPNVGGVVGLADAIAYLEAVGGESSDPLAAAFTVLAHREMELANLATERLLELGGINIHGTASHKAGIVSFTMAEAHPHDVGTILDNYGIAVRTGHHCCMPLMKRFGLNATTRASFAFYNNEEDVERLIAGVKKVKELFAA